MSGIRHTGPTPAMLHAIALYDSGLSQLAAARAAGVSQSGLHYALKRRKDEQS